MEILNEKSVIELSGKYNGKTVREILDKNPKSILQLIKKGLCFDDNVLKEANITKVIRDHHAYYDLEKATKDTKHYEVDKASWKDIIKSVEVLDNDNIDVIDDSKEENDEEYE